MNILNLKLALYKFKLKQYKDIMDEVIEDCKELDKAVLDIDEKLHLLSSILGRVK